MHYFGYSLCLTICNYFTQGGTKDCIMVVTQRITTDIREGQKRARCREREKGKDKKKEEERGRLKELHAGLPLHT